MKSGEHVYLTRESQFLAIDREPDYCPEYLEHVGSIANGYIAMPYTDDVELSVRLGWNEIYGVVMVAFLNVWREAADRKAPSLPPMQTPEPDPSMPPDSPQLVHK